MNKFLNKSKEELINELQKLEQEVNNLKESEGRYKTFFNSTSDFAFIKDEKFRYILVNKANLDFFGLTENEVYGKTDWELMPDIAVICHKSDQEVIQKNETIIIEETVGGKIFETRKFPILFNNGKIGTGGFVKDITAQKQVEKTLIESEKKFRATFEQAAVGVALLNTRTGQFVSINQKYCDFIGYSMSEMLQKTFMDITHPEDVQTNINKNSELIDGLLSEFSYEKRYVCKDGKIIWGRLTISPLWKQGENPHEYFHIAIVENITESKLTEEALIESEEKYRNLVELAADGIIIIQNGIVVFANDAMIKMGKYPKEEVIGSPFLKFVAEDKKDEIKQMHITRAKGEPVPSRYETVLHNSENEKVDAEISISEITFRSEMAFLAIIHDITENKFHKENLQKSEEKYRMISENASDIIWTMDINTGKFTYFSPSVKQIRGYTPEEAIELSLEKTVTPGSYQKLMKVFNEEMRNNNILSLDSNRTILLEYEHICKDGSINIMETRISAIKDINGKPVAIQGISRDITERRKAEDSLRTSERQLANAMHIAKLGYWEYNVAKDLFTFNDHFYAIFRTTAEQEGGYEMTSACYARRFVHPDDMSVVGIEIQKALESSDPNYNRQIEHRIIFADGEIGYIIVRFFIEKDENGCTVKTYGANQDITERKQVEEAFRESEQKFRSYIEDAPDGIYVLDNTGQYIGANQAGCSIVGYSAEELQKLSIRNLTSDEFLEEGLVHFKKIIETGKADFEILYKHKGGSKRWLSISAVKLSESTILSFAKDITERKQTEKELANYRNHLEELVKERTAELEIVNSTKDKFFSIIAHDLKNPFAGILSSCELLKRSIIKQDMVKIEKHTNTIQTSSKNAYALLDNILNWSRLQMGKCQVNKEKNNIHSLIIDSIASLQVIASMKEIKLILSTNKKVYTLFDKEMFNTIIRNLITNAIKFSNKGQNIYIGVCELNEKQLKISVKDEGVGMSKEILSKLFNVDVSNTNYGTNNEKGTGLGLLLCKEFAEKNNSEIIVESEEGKGSTFSFNVEKVEE